MDLHSKGSTSCHHLQQAGAAHECHVRYHGFEGQKVSSSGGAQMSSRLFVALNLAAEETPG